MIMGMINLREFSSFELILIIDEIMIIRRKIGIEYLSNMIFCPGITSGRRKKQRDVIIKRIDGNLRF